MLEDLGTVPENVRELVQKQEDSEKLKAWLKLVAKSRTINEFEELIKYIELTNIQDYESGCLFRMILIQYTMFLIQYTK